MSRLRSAWRFLALSGVALATLLAVDLLVNLGLLQRLLLGDPLPARALDFVALACMLTPASLALALAAWIGGALLARRDRAGDGTAALLGGLLTALVVLGMVRLAGASLVVVLPLGGGVGLGIWAALGALLRRAERAPGLLAPALLPALAAAFLVAAAQRALAASWTEAILAAAAGALLLAAAWTSLQGSAGARRSGLAAWPLILALALAGQAVVASARFGAASVSTHRDGRPERPSIVVIVLDTVRADHLRAWGYPRDTMPGLERWAERSLLFERALSPAGWTSPAHASLFSGLPVSLHGVHYALRRGPVLATRARDGISWLPAKLAAEGYYCLAVSANPFAITPDIAGFHRVLERQRFAWENGTLAGLADHYPPILLRPSEWLRWRTPYIDAAGITDTVLRALPSGDRPVFLFVNYLDAHAPYNPPRSALDELGLAPGHRFGRYSSHRELTQRWSSLPPGSAADLADLYDGELRFLDDHLTRLLAEIDRRLGPRTVVVVASDHGEELGEEGRVGHEWGLPQRVVHVPLMVRAPDLAPGRESRLTSLRSLYPYLLEVAAGHAPGVDVLLATDAYGLVAERYPTEHNVRSVGEEALRPWVALFADGLKGIGPSSQGFELFDFATDFAVDAGVADLTRGEALRQRIDAYWEQHHDQRAGDTAAASEEELRSLRSLGYVQ